MSRYQYEPLPPITRRRLNLLYTRFLTLLPREKSDAIRCSLEIEHLESAPPYEALSYVWGSGEASFSISCDNMTFNIKSNLFQALRHLRLQSQPRRLWVDAICIDQANVRERSRQVAYMTQIYRQASTVVVWLGLKTPGVEQAFHFASEIAELQGRLHNAPGGVYIPGGKEAARYNPEAFSKVMAALRSKPEAAGYLMDLFEREYFERIWCIQEVWSSRKCIARCENLDIDFYKLLETTIYVEELTRPSKEQTFSRQLWVTVSSKRPKHAPSFFSGELEGSCGDLLGLLVTMRDLKSTDPRDKIYALLGISDEGIRPALASTADNTPDGLGFAMIRKAMAWTLESMDSLFPDKGFMSSFKALQPDYETSVKDLYSGITTFLLTKGHKYLDVLSHVQHTKDPIESPLPSWIPNWVEPRSVSIMEMDCFWAGVPPEGRYGQYANIYEDRDDPDVLGLDGFPIDQIEKVSDVIRFTPFDPLPAEQIWTQLFDMPLFPRPSRRYPNGDSLDHAFFMTLGLSPRGGLPTAIPQLAKMPYPESNKCAVDVCREHVKANIAAWLRERVDVALYPELASAVDSCEGHGDAKAYVRWAAAFTTNRRFFLTRQGYLGLGPTAMQSGDQLCVLLGGRLPFVLRSTSVDKIYTFIGEAYVYDEEILSGRTGIAARTGRGGWEVKTYLLK